MDPDRPRYQGASVAARRRVPRSEAEHVLLHVEPRNYEDHAPDLASAAAPGRSAGAPETAALAHEASIFQAAFCALAGARQKPRGHAPLAPLRPEPGAQPGRHLLN